MRHCIGQECQDIVKFFPLMGLKHDMEMAKKELEKQQKFLAWLMDKKDFKYGVLDDWNQMLLPIQVDEMCGKKTGDSFLLGVLKRCLMVSVIIRPSGSVSAFVSLDCPKWKIW